MTSMVVMVLLMILKAVMEGILLRLRCRLVLLLPEEDAAPLFLPATFA